MDAHPSTVHIFQLWQIYVDNVNPLLKVTHIPTVQGQILNAVADLSKAPQNIECLLFAIYTIAISSLEEAQVRERFGDSKRSLQRMYAVAAQQAFVNAGFMRVNDLVTLQAFFIYLVRYFPFFLCTRLLAWGHPVFLLMLITYRARSTPFSVSRTPGKPSS